VSTHRSGRSSGNPKSARGGNYTRAASNKPSKHATITAENLAILNRLNGDDDRYDPEEVSKTKESNEQAEGQKAAWWPNFLL
jgi:hypothetical protein